MQSIICWNIGELLLFITFYCYKVDKSSGFESHFKRNVGDSFFMQFILPSHDVTRSNTRLFGGQTKQPEVDVAFQNGRKMPTKCRKKVTFGD